MEVEELYPGEVDGAARSFYVAGRAMVISPVGVSQSIDTGKLIAGFRWFGRRNLFVHHPGAPSPRQPSFDFQLLTSELVANLIYSDPSFQFSLESKHLGKVTYVSGAAARDRDDREQGIISLHATGKMGADGLKFNFKGELARPFVIASTYELDFDIPWSILRFMFYEQVGFINNYRTFHSVES